MVIGLADVTLSSAQTFVIPDLVDACLGFRLRYLSSL